MGARPSLARRLSHDRRGAGRRAVLFPARPQRGSGLHHQDHGGAGRVARRDDRRHAEAGHRAARAQAAGNAAARFPAQLHDRRRHDDLRQSEGQRDRQGGDRHLVSRPQEHRRHAPHLPAGIVGPGFNDEFGDTFGIIYGFTADGFTHRELRDYVEGRPLEAAACPRRLEDRDPGRPGRADLRRILDEGARQPRHRSLGADRARLQAQNVVRPAGTIQTGRRNAVAARVRRVPLRAGYARTSTSPSAAACCGLATSPRSGAALPIRRSRMFRVNGEPAIGLAIAMRDGGDILALGQEHQARDGRDHRRSADRHRAEAGGGSGGDGRERHLRVHDVAVAGGRASFWW